MWEGVDMGKLTVLSERALREPGRYGDGLYLHVAPAGTKSWVQRIVINDKRRDIGLGSYPSVGVAQARIMAADNRAAVAEGRDPLAENREAKDAARNPTPSVPTFAEAAAAVIDLRCPTWSNPKHAAQWESTMATYVYPIIGDMAVNEISAVDVLEVLESIWTTKPETATRVRQRMETVTDWAEELMDGYSSAADAPLAHRESRKTQRAYKRTDFFNARIGLMQRWADFVTGRESNQEGD